MPTGKSPKGAKVKVPAKPTYSKGGKNSTGVRKITRPTPPKQTGVKSISRSKPTHGKGGGKGGGYASGGVLTGHHYKPGE